MLSNYAIAVLTSSNRWAELKILIDSLSLVKYKKLYIGNVGLINKHKKNLEDLGATIIPLNANTIGKDPSDKLYHSLISQRVPFLREIWRLHKGSILQLDTDTEFIKDDFKHLDMTTDATMHVRGDDGPNCGVMFWHKPERCQEFWDTWEDMWRGPVTLRCPEQDCFGKALQACKINWQELHCRYYNCMKDEWINKDTSIIHYKGKIYRREELRQLCAAF